ncbi:MAG: cyclic nucleotide-binding domain-containing protein [Nostoc sp. DedQUE12a]|nr:cyclic nucleotide-binding domain-containing protein [Nostoc sp. DedQUE12a]
MREVLLQELSNSDIDWMLGKSHKHEISDGTVLVQAGKNTNIFHILLEGTLIATVSQNRQNPLARAFATIEGDGTSALEVTRLSTGEVVGESSLVGVRSTTNIQALEKCLLMSIPVAELEAKLKQDIGFAARLYRAIAILYSDRLQSLISRVGRSKLVQIQPVRDVLFIFGQLHDSDLDWFTANGKLKRIAAQEILLRQGGPVDALYVLLQGQMTVSISSDRDNPLTRIFATLEGNTAPEQEIAKLYKGEILGEGTFIDGRLPYGSIKAVEDSLVLAIARSQLLAKLQQDVGFAARFYRAIVTLLSDRFQGLLNRMGYRRHTYSPGQTLSEKVKYDDEVDFDVLEQMSLAAVRFDWMLENLKAI